jgi:transketolase
MTDLRYVPESEFRRLRSLSLPPRKRAELFAGLCRINTLYMIARAGSGHIGSSFSSLDIVSWLFLNEIDNAPAPFRKRAGTLYFSSKGHDVPGLYAVLIGMGLVPFDRLHALRRLGGLPGHPDIFTPFIAANTGSLGMGISKAKGMILANRLRGETCRIYVMTGDGELQEGQIWESLQPAANARMSELTVIVDHNGLQSDTWVRATSPLGDLEAKFSAFGWFVTRCNGHDMTDIARAVARCKRVKDRPQVILADTVKGKGVSFMASTALEGVDALYRYHSGAPSAEDYLAACRELTDRASRLLRIAGAEPLATARRRCLKPAPPAKAQSLIRAYEQTLARLGRKESRLVVLDADLRKDCGLLTFRNAFPERFLECGIAEQDMVSLAGGLALAGHLPVVHSFAAFLTARANEQIGNNATEKRKILYVGTLAGLLPATPGHSHQAVRDIAALRAVPGLLMIAPCCEDDTARALDYCVRKTAASCYLRLASVPCPVPYRLPEPYELIPGRGATLRPGRDGALIGYGPVMLTEAFLAAEILKHRCGIDLEVIHLPWLNALDIDWLSGVAARHGWFFTLDDHALEGGQGEMISACLAETGLVRDRHIRRFGVTGIPACGRNDEVLKAHGLDRESLVAAVASSLLGRPRRRAAGISQKSRLAGAAADMAEG